MLDRAFSSFVAICLDMLVWVANYLLSSSDVFVGKFMKMCLALHDVVQLSVR